MQDFRPDFCLSVPGWDTVFVLSSNVTLRLRSQVLRDQAKYFQARLVEADPVRASGGGNNTNAGDGDDAGKSRVCYHFYLLQAPATGKRKLVQKHSSEPALLVEIGKTEDAVAKDPVGRGQMERWTNCWHWVLEHICGHPSRLWGDTVEQVYQNCNLIKVVVVLTGVSLDVVDIAETALGQHRDDLWLEIASAPETWLKRAYRLRIPTVFREALAHAVGRYHNNDVAQQWSETLPWRLQRLCRTKTKELAKTKKRAETDIMLLDLGPERRDLTRTGSAWHVARTLFRGWWTEACENVDRNRNSRDGGYRLYKMIADGGDAYLTRQQILDRCRRQRAFSLRVRNIRYRRPGSGFRRLTSGAEFGREVVERAAALKEEMRESVGRLMENKTHLDERLWPQTTLLCTTVGDDELPWLNLPEDMQDPFNEKGCDGECRTNEDGDGDGDGSDEED